MAVEIPVIVDIEGAFQEAANRTRAAIKPLQRIVSDEALRVQVGVIIQGEDRIPVFLKDIKEKGLAAGAQIGQALSNVENALIRVVETGDKAKFNALLEAKHYLMDMETAARSVRGEIDGLASTLNGLQARVSAAQTVLNTTKLNSPEWYEAAKAISVASKEVEKYRTQISTIGTEKGSIARMNIQLQELQQKWANMSPSKMFKADGTLSNEAQQLQNRYTEIASQVQKTTSLLSQQHETLKKEEAEYNALLRAETERERVLNRQANTISDLGAKLQAARQVLESTNMNSQAFEKAAEQVREVERAMESVQRRLAELGVRSGSLDQLNLKLQEVQKKWNAMGEGQMFDANGGLSKYAQNLQQQYAKVTEKIERQRKALSAVVDAQREAEQAQKKRLAAEEAALERQIAQEDAARAAAQRHREELAMTANSINELNTKLAAWRQELNNAAAGSTAFANIAKTAGDLARQLEAVNAQARILGANTGSIDQLNAKLQEINRQYNALSVSDRRGAQGAKLLNDYRQISQELEKEGQSLQQIIQLEQRRAEESQKAAQKRQQEKAILNSTVKSLDVLQEKERILMSQLSATEVGTAKFDQLKTKLQAVRAEIDGITQSIRPIKPAVDRTSDSLKNQSGIFMQLKSMAGMYVSVFGALRFVKQIRDVTAELEYQRVALGHLIQDEAYGAKLFDDIKKAAVESPFRIKELVTYTKQMAAYRIETENLFDTTKRLADVSAGLGVDIDRLILAYGQVRAASVLRGQELRQFTEAGIPLVELLADKFTELKGEMVSTADVFRLISERAVPFSMISEIFEDMTDKGGMFYDMQRIQADTLLGRWEKLKDTFDIALQSIGDSKGLLSFRGEMNLILKVLNLVAANLRVIPKLLEGAATAWIVYSTAQKIALRNQQIEISRTAAANAQKRAEIALRGKVFASVQAEVVARRKLTAAYYAEATATNFATKALARMRIAFMTNPWGAALAAISAIVVALASFRKRSEEATSQYVEFQEAIKKLSESEQNFTKTEKLIDSYERLAQKADRSAKENIKLNNAVTALSERFPDLSLSVNDVNEKLEKNVQLLRERNEQERLANIQQAYRDRELMESNLTRLQEQRTKVNAEYVRIMQSAEAEGVSKRQKNKFEDQANALRQQLTEIDGQISTTLRDMEALDKYLNPQNVDWSGWQNQLRRLRSYTSEGLTKELFGESEIESWESLYKASTDLKKQWTDAKETYEGLSAAVKNATPESVEELTKERDAAKDMLDALERINKFFGFDWGRTKSTSPSFLKEELKTVQDIYKKYKEFLGYMSEGDAQKKIKEIYGGVTTIDFLSPESYKKRLQSILTELRKFQGQVEKLGANLSAKSAKDLTEFLLAHEGFSAVAEDIERKGKGFTLGYGFYDTLPDGRKITAGMSITKEEARELFEQALPKYVKIASQALAKFGEGVELTEKQFNVLVDLAYQSPAALNRVLESASGDINKIAENLKDATSINWVGDKLYEGLKKRDMDRYTNFMSSILGDVDQEELVSIIADAEKIVQDVDWNEMKDAIVNKIKEVSDEVKRSDAARKFYENILSLTGDEDFARTVSIDIYGDIGKDFRDNVQMQLDEAFQTFDVSDYDLWDKMRIAIENQDFDFILANLKKFPEEWQKVLKELVSDTQKYNADIMQDFAKLVEKFGTTEEKIATIRAKAQQEIERTISAAVTAAGSAESKEQADAILARAESIVKALEAQMDLDVFKQTDEYINFFSEVNTMTAEQAALVRGEVRAAYIKAFQDGALSASQLAKELRAIDTQFKKLSEHSSLLGSYLSGGVDKAIEKLQEYADTIQILGSKISSGKSLNEGEQNFVTNMLGAFGGKFGGDSLKGIESFQDLMSTFSQNGKGVQAAGEAFSQMGEGMSAMAAEGGGALAIVDMIVKAVNQTIIAIQSVIDELNKMRSADKQIAGWFRYVSDFNKYAYSGWENLKSGNLAGMAADVINSIVSIFNNVQLGKVNRLNKKIEEQQDILADLEYSYGRVEAAMAKAFGNDYVESYNRQLDNLLAQQEAYLRQAELERKKGKSSDKEKIKEYENAARDTADQIADMQSQLSEFFAGTDLTSAATDFAEAWIEAYKQFGSTTDAMKEKFQDMIENMITNSLAAKLMQSILQPLFDEIDQMALSGNELSASEIGQIAAEAPDYINRINNAMTTLMNQMAAAGYNVRQQAGSFTGISRSIAGASEESINGLAAGINTQNFYISYVPTISANVAAILSVLGGSPASPNAAPNAEEGPSYEDQMLMYTAYLPQMHDDMAAVRQMLERVIKPLGVSATHYVAIR